MIDQKKLMAMDPKERMALLRSHADKCEEREVPVPLEQDERSRSEHEITQLYVKMKGLADKKKDLVKDLNLQIRELRDELNLLADEVKTGNRIEVRQVFSILNQDTNMIEEFSQDGLLLSSLRAPRLYQQGLRPVERDQVVNEE